MNVLKNASLILCAASAIWLESSARAQALQPTSIEINHNSYQVIYQNSPRDNTQIPAILQNTAGRQGTALFLFSANITRATFYMFNGSNYLYTLTKTATNLTYLTPPPTQGTNDQIVVSSPKTLSKKVGDAFVATSNAPVTVDVLILYTPSAATNLGGVSNVENAAAMSIAEANQAYTDSKVYITLKLVGVALIPFTETSSLTTDLGNFYNNKTAQALREQYNADLVCLFENSSDGYYSGMAYVLSGTSDMGYSVVQAKYAVGYYVLPHELSHNFGCQHDFANANVPGVFSYSYGWRFNANGLQFRTIMAYPPGIQVGYFSCPNNYFLGVATGTTNADNVDTLNQRAATIAAFRAPPSNTVTITRNGTGAVLRYGTNSPAILTVTQGSTVTLTAQGSFVGWSRPVASANNTIQFVVTTNTALTANFADGPQPLAPVVTLQPASQNVPTGGQLQLVVSAYGLPTPSFCWLKYGANAAVTGTTFNVTGVTASDQGRYSCIISNSAGAVETLTALVSVGNAPQIVQQPVSQLADIGDSAAFSVVTDTAGVTYQWFGNGAAIAGATNRVLLLSHIQATDMGNYYVQIYVSGLTLTSATAQLYLPASPNITLQPVGSAVTLGTPSSFTVNATGLAPLTYQWTFNGNVMAGQTNASLSFASTQNNAAGVYAVRITNPNGITTSTNAELVVYNPLVISQQPNNITIVKGSTPIFGVTAGGSAPVTYQWFWNGTALRNQVYNTCRLQNVQVTNAGTYYVIVTNPSGSLQSSNATLTVLDPPVFTAQPQQTTVDQGSPAAFTVQLSGKAPFGFQWFHNGTAISGATAQALTISSALPSDAGNYSVTVTNSDGSASSYTAALVVNTPPAITMQPVSTSGTVAGSASFYVMATGVTPIYFYWKGNGQAVGPSSQSLNLSNLQTNQAGTYQVIVSNRLGTVTSTMATLAVSDPPRITLASSLSADEGSVLLIVPTILGKQPMTYAWKFNNTVLAGQTSAALTITNVQVAAAGYYSLTVNNADGAVTPSSAQVSIFALPRVTSQPASTTNANGANVTLSASASGGAPLSYQWFFGASAVPGATNLSYTLPSIALANEGNYYLQVTNRIGKTNSQTATLTVSYPPVITTQPLAQTLNQGGIATFSVAVDGRTPFTYQWLKNSATIAGATGATLTLTTLGASDSGNYSVQIQNADGSATSQSVPLTVVTPPVITVQPADVTVNKGQAAQLSATVSAPSGCTYQWIFNGTNISGENGTALSLANIQLSQAGTYQMRATDSAGSVLTRSARVTVKDPPTFTTQPAIVSYHCGDTVTLTAQASSGVTPITYQWFKAGSALAGKTSSQLSLTSATASTAGSYSVQAMNADGTNSSAAATATYVSQPPVFLVNLPANITINPGATLALSVNAQGLTPLTYTWKFNGAPISGQTTNTLSIPNVQTNNAGSYQVTVANLDGSVSSAITVVQILASAPIISTQPVSQIKPAGSTVTFSVLCGNPANVTYQWFKSQTAVTGATNSYLTLSNIQSGDEAGYYVRLSNPFGATASSVASLQIMSPPTITVAPQSVLAFAGASATFSVTAQGSRTISFQWWFNGTKVGLDSSTLTVSSVSTNAAGSYWVTVSNQAGTNTSATATLTLRQSPVITLQPVGVYCKAGNSAVFSVAVTGRAPLSYQWFWNNSSLPGATSSGLILTNVQSGVTGNYYVMVSNPDGSTNSRTVALTLDSPPVITAQPQDVALASQSGTATLSVTATSGSPMNYQWAFNGTNLPGAVSSTLTLTSVSPQQEGNYQVTISNAVGAANSRAAFVRVAQPPVITVQPVGNAVCLNSNFTFTVAATGRAPLSYRWIKQGATITGASTASYTVTSIKSSDIAVYAVILSNADGTVTSQDANLTLVPGQPAPPSIIAQPQSVDAIQGAAANFAVQAGGANPLTYQWKLNGANLAGQTTARLAINSVMPANVGNYTVVITNVYGSVASATAALNIVYLPAIASQPTNVTAVQGGTLTISMVTSNATSFCWKQNGTLVLTTNQPVLTIANVQPLAAGSYTMTASNSVGSVTSLPVTGTVFTPPVINVQPSGVYVAMGGTTSLSVTASGLSPLSYQWNFGGTPISGATLATLSISNAQPVNEGYYTVKVANPYGSITSSQAPVTVRNPPAIVQQPASTVTAIQGSNVSFSVSASGRTPRTFQWYKYPSSALAGATNSTLALNGVTSGNAGAYYVQAANSDGAVFSQMGTLTVLVPPYYTSTAASITPTLGSMLVMSANMSGSAPMTYQWSCNGAAIAGATSGTLTMTNIQVTQDGTYSVTAVNSAGTATANNYIVHVKAVPTITAQPASALVVAGASTTLSIAASGRDPLTYQWYFRTGNGSAWSPISGATGPSLTLNGFQAPNEGQYYAGIQNSDGMVNSLIVTLTLIRPPAISLQPTNVTVPLNKSVTIFANYVSVVPITMQWLKNGTPIIGATNPVITIASALIADQGSYVLNVANSAGSTNSLPATLTVTYPPVILVNLPAQTVVNQGGTVELSIVADGKIPMSFTWSFNGRTIVGPNTSILTIRNIQTNQAGYYYVNISNLDGSVLSAAAWVTVRPVPVITSQPTTTIVTVSNSFQLQVGVTGSGPFTYQWVKDGTNIVGATQSTYTVTNAMSSDSGRYVALVSNSYGMVQTDPAIVVVLPIQPLVIPQDPTQPVIIQLVSIFDGAKGMLFYGAVGQVYQIQSSDDLSDWTAQTNITMAHGVAQFVDQDAPNHDRRFYRIKHMGQ